MTVPNNSLHDPDHLAEVARQFRKAQDIGAQWGSLERYRRYEQAAVVAQLRVEVVEYTALLRNDINAAMQASNGTRPILSTEFRERYAELTRMREHTDNAAFNWYANYTPTVPTFGDYSAIGKPHDETGIALEMTFDACIAAEEERRTEQGSTVAKQQSQQQHTDQQRAQSLPDQQHDVDL